MLDLVYDLDANRYTDLANITRKAVAICNNGDQVRFREVMEALEDTLHTIDRDAHRQVIEKLYHWGIIPIGAVDFPPLNPKSGLPELDAGADVGPEAVQSGDQGEDMAQNGGRKEVDSGEIDETSTDVEKGSRANSIDLGDD